MSAAMPAAYLRVGARNWAATLPRPAPGTGKAGFPNAPATLPRRLLSVQLRWEQCCATQDCIRPARYGDLCTACFLAATPQRRGERTAGARAPDALAACPEDVVDPAGAAWLRELWAA